MRELTILLFASFSLSAAARATQRARNMRVDRRPNSRSLHLYCLALSLGCLLAAPLASAQTYSVGNLVWLDSNNDGKFDGAEQGISGVTVELLDSTNAVIGTETTDSQGYYRFDNVPAGSNYHIFFPGSNFTGAGALAGLTVSSVTDNGHSTSDDGQNHGLYTPNPVEAGVASAQFNVPIAGGDPTGEKVNVPGVSVFSGNGPGGDAFDDLTVDFGFTPAYSIGNFVWIDTNNNGVVDAGETGVAGVQVQLFDSGNSLVTAMTADANGYYRFDYVPAGSYYVEIPASNFLGGRPLGGYLPSSVVDNGHTITDDNHNHGIYNPNPTSGGVKSAVFSVPVAGGDPTGESTSGSTYGGYGPTGDANDDLTVDFGFALPVTATSISMTSGPAGNTPYGSTTPYVANITVTGSGTATGPVTFCDTTAATCTGPSDPNAIGTVTLTNASNNIASLVPSTPLSVGSHTIIAHYGGDTSNGPSTSSNSIVTNIQATNTITSYTLTPGGGTASAPPVTIVYSQPVSATATVAAQTGGGTPTGAVQFAVDGSVVGSPVALAGGSTATGALGSSLAIGNHTVSATYTPAGGTGWNGSAGNNGGATAMVVNPASSNVGAPAISAGAGTTTPTFTIDVTGAAPATANPTSGLVTLYDGIPGNVGASTQVGSVNLAGTNRATIQSSALSPGGHTIWAAFAGTTQFSSGSSAGISYTSPTATHFTVTAPGSAISGSAFSVTVTALDASNNVVSGYTGTVHFTSTDTQASLPANYTFTAGDAGVHTFTNGVTLRAMGNQTITVTDTSSGSITGTSGSVTVLGPPSIATTFTPSVVAFGSNSMLAFTITNPNPTVAQTGVGFTDALPANLVLATPNGLTGSCGGGTITATAGSASISLTGAALAPGASCTFSVNVTGPVGTYNNTTSFVNSGNSGNGNSASATLTVANIRIAPTTLPGGTYGTVYSSQTLTATGTTAPYTFAVTAGALPGGLSLSSGGVLSGTLSASGTFNFTVTATDADGGKGSQAYTVAVTQAGQTLTFNTQSPSSHTFVSGGTFPINPLATSATPNSGNAVSYSSLSTGVCTVSGTTVTIVSTGTCTLAANQSGNTNYVAAAQQTQSVAIGVASQTISFSSTPPASPMVSGSYTVTATGGASGSPVVFTIDVTSTAGACTASGNSVSFIGVGTCIVDANQAGNANYAAAPQVQQTITIGKKTTTITLTATPTVTNTGSPVSLIATVTGDPPTGVVSFSDNGTLLSTCASVPLIPGTTSSTATCTTTFTTTGTHSITATYTGDASFAQATSSILAVTIGVPATPAPMLDRWATLLLGMLLGMIGCVRRARTL